jgi:hypothetical protein
LIKHFILTAYLLVAFCHVTLVQLIKGKAVSVALYFSDRTEIVAPFTYHEKKQIIVGNDTSAMQVYTTIHVDSFFFYDPQLMC